MERTNPFLFKSSIRQFQDLTNYKPNTTNPDAFKQGLKSSSVYQNNFEQKTPRSISSRNQNCVKGPNRYDQTNNTTTFSLTLPLENLKTSESSHNQIKVATTPRNTVTYVDQVYPSYTEPNFFTAKKPIQSTLNLSLKASGIVYQNDAPYFGQNGQKQNKPERIPLRLKDEKSIDKEKFNFRDSLGSLSKQIKNTLKLPIKNLIDSHASSTVQKQQEGNLTPRRTVHHVRSRAGSIKLDEGNPKKQSKTSLFFADSSMRLKRPRDLQLKSNNDLNLEKQKSEHTEKNIYTEIVPKKQKYSIYNLETQRLPLGRSTVTTVFQNQNELKYSYVVEPLTPQLRTGKKYDSYNCQNQKQQKPKPSFFQSTVSIKQQIPVKPADSHTRNSSIVTNVTANKTGLSKSSFMASSYVLESSKFAKDRDNLSTRQRSSFGKEMTLNDFHLGSVKGEGRFGKFYPAVHKKTGFLVGIKEIKKESLKHMLDQFIQELKIQTFIDHPNIVKLYGYFCTKENFYLILEYMQEGSLFTFIKKAKKVQEQEASAKLKQICSAVQYLHENEILHRDIKPENIVMTCDVCKLCDFGWAVYSSTRRKTYCGTLDYVCPQILQGDSYDACVDIWAIGVLAYEMIVGKAPFYNISRKETMKKIMECNFEVPKEVSIKAKDFVLKALNKNPQCRQSVEALCKHEFLK